MFILAKSLTWDCKSWSVVERNLDSIVLSLIMVETRWGAYYVLGPGIGTSTLTNPSQKHYEVGNFALIPLCRGGSLGHGYQLRAEIQTRMSSKALLYLQTQTIPASSKNVSKSTDYQNHRTDCIFQWSPTF